MPPPPTAAWVTGGGGGRDVETFEVAANVAASVAAPSNVARTVRGGAGSDSLIAGGSDGRVEARASCAANDAV